MYELGKLLSEPHMKLCYPQVAMTISIQQSYGLARWSCASLLGSLCVCNGQWFIANGGNAAPTFISSSKYLFYLKEMLQLTEELQSK
jgi:hypothetical protein